VRTHCPTTAGQNVVVVVEPTGCAVVHGDANVVDRIMSKPTVSTTSARAKDPCKYLSCDRLDLAAKTSTSNTAAIETKIILQYPDLCEALVQLDFCEVVADLDRAAVVGRSKSASSSSEYLR
jgi:hypothetical protein